MENQEEVKKEAPKKREIKKIAVSVGGLKGLVLSGTVESMEKNKPITHTFVDGLKSPIHRELEDKIADLRAHWLEINGLVTETTKKDKVYELQESCAILSIEFELGDGGFFKIKGSSVVLDSKFISFSTPKVEATDNYEWFNVVMDLIKEILVEVDHYVNKTKVISNEELMIAYIKHGKGVGINMDEYESMDREAKAEYLTKLLTKEGFIANVMDTEEMNEEDVEEVLEALEEGNLIEENEETPVKDNGAGVNVMAESNDLLDIAEPHFESKVKGKK